MQFLLSRRPSCPLHSRPVADQTVALHGRSLQDIGQGVFEKQCRNHPKLDQTRINRVLGAAARSVGGRSRDGKTLPWLRDPAPLLRPRELTLSSHSTPVRRSLSLPVGNPRGAFPACRPCQPHCPGSRRRRREKGPLEGLQISDRCARTVQPIRISRIRPATSDRPDKPQPRLTASCHRRIRSAKNT